MKQLLNSEALDTSLFIGSSALRIKALSQILLWGSYYWTITNLMLMIYQLIFECESQNENLSVGPVGGLWTS